MKKAFTLAEMLIVIAIIGVVAALVMPSLMANYQNRVLMTQLKKSYAEISQAGLLAIAQEDGGTFKSTKSYRQGNFLNKYFKKTKSCSNDNISDCIGESYVDSDGNDFNAIEKILVKNKINKCIKAKTGYTFCLCDGYPMAFLDVNGQKGPNQVGKDAFTVLIANDGSIDDSYDVNLKKIVENDWEIE